MIRTYAVRISDPHSRNPLKTKRTKTCKTSDAPLANGREPIGVAEEQIPPEVTPAKIPTTHARRQAIY